MNIFYVSENAVDAAQSLVDRHVVKMILESAQLLSTAHRVLDGELIEGKKVVENTIPPKYRKYKEWKLLDARDVLYYKATHVNHPSAIWARTSIQNYLWLSEHLMALLDEYTYRYGKKHKCSELAYYLQTPPLNLKRYEMTKMPSAMAEEYIISDDPITNYRNYYKNGKKHLHSWKKREMPQWMI